MTRFNRGVVLTLVGLLALQMSLTDAMLSFLRPTMRPWLVLAGATLTGLGVAALLGSRRENEGGAHGHTHGIRVGWLLVLPLCAGVLAPNALDSRAAQRASAWRGHFGPTHPFDLDAYLRANAVTGGIPRLELVDYLSAVNTHPAYLEAHPIRLVGFVTPDDAPNRFLLTRFFVGCCAADAFPMQVDVMMTGDVPKSDTWVEVQVRLLPDAASARDANRPPPTRALALHRIGKPSEPYEYPG